MAVGGLGGTVSVLLRSEDLILPWSLSLYLRRLPSLVLMGLLSRRKHAEGGAVEVCHWRHDGASWQSCVYQNLRTCVYVLGHIARAVQSTYFRTSEEHILLEPQIDWQLQLAFCVGMLGYPVVSHVFAWSTAGRKSGSR